MSPTIKKLYYSISEVSEITKLKAYVLRYWETEFPQLSPGKRRGNRRYYQANDVLLVSKIKFLLYEKGFTIYGAKLSLKEKPLTKDVEASNLKFTKELTEKINVAGISAGDCESLKKEIRLIIDVLDGKIET